MSVYKVLSADGRSCHGGILQWSLPGENPDGTWTPGEWTPEIEGDLVPCKNGYHLCREQDLVYWLNDAIFEAEYRGEMVESDNKIVVREARLLRRITSWNARTARLFAVWCARRAMARVGNPDMRSVAACDTAERYANGEATDEELTAAWSAARSAARSAAMSAAGYAAMSAAWSAAGSAAGSAASSAASSASWTAEREAQVAKLIEMLGGGG